MTGRRMPQLQWRALWRGQSMSTRPAGGCDADREGAVKGLEAWGLIMVGTPWCMIVFVTGWTRVCAESGTWLIQTRRCMVSL